MAIHPYFRRRFLTKGRLATRYMFLSMLVALVPLLGLSILYDAYFADLVAQVSSKQVTAKLAATQNGMRNLIRDWAFELEELADQLDDPALFRPGAAPALSDDLENLLRLYVDSADVYGVVFYDSRGTGLWSFPADLTLPDTVRTLPRISVEQADVLGPSLPSYARPGWLIVRRAVAPRAGEVRSPGMLGMVFRFASLSETMRDLVLPGIQRPLLEVPDGRLYDPVGQLSTFAGKAAFETEILPGWRLHLRRERLAVTAPSMSMRYWLVLLVAGIIVAIVWIYSRVSARLNRQIDGLVERVEKVARGDLETPIRAEGRGEIRRVAVAFENMRRQLKKLIHSTLDFERRAVLGQLAAGIAHEIRNPLATIKTTIDALARQEADPERAELMGMVKDEIDRTGGVIQHMLDYARPSEPTACGVAVAELFEGVAVLLHAAARPAGVRIVTDPGADLRVWADPAHLRQVLMNLVLNSLEAMAAHGGEIRLEARRGDRRVILSVTDEGSGIADDDLARVTEPFFTTKETGTGLGLAICARLVTANGGRLRIENRKRRGCCVRLDLPAMQDDWGGRS